MSIRYIRYTGIDRRGVSQAGCLHAADPSDLAERLFQKGFRSASITDMHGNELGGVCRQIDNPRRRTWWAERSGDGQ